MKGGRRNGKKGGSRKGRTKEREEGSIPAAQVGGGAVINCE